MNDLPQMIEGRFYKIIPLTQNNFWRVHYTGKYLNRNQTDDQYNFDTVMMFEYIPNRDTSYTQQFGLEIFHFNPSDYAFEMIRNFDGKKSRRKVKRKSKKRSKRSRRKS
jgi:hypothetical protein